MVEKHRAETWQKRGIVRIEQQQQRQVQGPPPQGGAELVAASVAEAQGDVGVTTAEALQEAPQPMIHQGLRGPHQEGTAGHPGGAHRFPRLFRSITKAQLLILDDWGPDRLTATQRRDLMEIVEDRYDSNPAEGKEGNDLLTTTSLSWSF